MVEEINLEWLKTFRTYVESETLEEVARKLEITQPAVSQHLAKLQKHFDTPLYFKKGKKKLATKQGLKLYHRISEVLLEIENSLRSFQLESKKSKNTEIRFGLSKELFCSISKHLKYEGSLNVITAASSDLLPMLKQNTVDAIMCEQSKLPKLSASLKNTFSVKNCLAHNFKLIASNDLKLANQLDLSEFKSLLEKQGLIINSCHQDSYDRLSKTLKIKENQLKVRMRFNEWNDLVHYLSTSASAKKSLALIPNTFPSPIGYQEIQVPFDKIFTSKLAIIYKKNTINIPGFDQFLDELMQTSFEQ